MSEEEFIKYINDWRKKFAHIPIDSLFKVITHAILYPGTNILAVYRNEESRENDFAKINKIINDWPAIENEVESMDDYCINFKSKSKITFICKED